MTATIAQKNPNDPVLQQRIGGNPPLPAAPKSLGMKGISKHSISKSPTQSGTLPIRAVGALQDAIRPTRRFATCQGRPTAAR
jgi:hypothetical protein